MRDFDRSLPDAVRIEADDLVEDIDAHDAAAGRLLGSAVEGREAAFGRIDCLSPYRFREAIDMLEGAEKVGVRADVDPGTFVKRDAKAGEPVCESLTADQNRARRCAQRPQQVIPGNLRRRFFPSTRSSLLCAGSPQGLM